MVGIAIVDYGKSELLQNCLGSLPYGIEDPFFKIKIFDCNKENIGFNAGNNKLIREFMLEPEIEWIWLLNNDTVVPETTLLVMKSILPRYQKDIDVIGFKILSMDNPDLIHHAGTTQCYPAGIHKSGSNKLGHHTKNTNEKWVTFASVLIRKEAFFRIGLLDENMFNYGGDSDFCYRVRASHRRVIYEPNFNIFHKIGSSQNPNPEQQTVIQSDMTYFANKWTNGKLYFDLSNELVSECLTLI